MDQVRDQANRQALNLTGLTGDKLLGRYYDREDRVIEDHENYCVVQYHNRNIYYMISYRDSHNILETVWV